MEIANAHVDAVIRDYIDRYLTTNRAARIVTDQLIGVGVGLRPVIDHLSVRTLDVAERALEFEALGYRYDDVLGVMERDSWWARVFRKPGFPPIYLDQPFRDNRGADSPMHEWVERFTDGGLHHIGIAVDSIEVAIETMRGLGIEFHGDVMGNPGSEFRQIYSRPEEVDGHPYTTLELVERRWGYTGFLSPLAPSS